MNFKQDKIFSIYTLTLEWVCFRYWQITYHGLLFLAILYILWPIHTIRGQKWGR